MKEWFLAQLQKLDLGAWMRWVILVSLVVFGARLGLNPGNTPPLPQEVIQPVAVSCECPCGCGCDKCKCGK